MLRRWDKLSTCFHHSLDPTGAFASVLLFLLINSLIANPNTNRTRKWKRRDRPRSFILPYCNDASNKSKSFGYLSRHRVSKRAFEFTAHSEKRFTSNKFNLCSGIGRVLRSSPYVYPRGTVSYLSPPRGSGRNRSFMVWPVSETVLRVRCRFRIDFAVSQTTLCK